MEFLELLQNIWFILIGVLFAGYAVLDGFDLGVGSLFPFLADSEEEKGALFDIIWPFWDGTRYGCLQPVVPLRRFSAAYATVYSGDSILRCSCALSPDHRAGFPGVCTTMKRGVLWEKTFVIGSFLPSLLFGVALGNVIVGIPLDSRMEFTGNFFTLLRPYPLSIGLLGLAAILLQGSTYTALKSEGTIQVRARSLVKKIWVLHIGTLVLAMLMSLFFLPDSFKSIPAWIFFLVTAATAFLSRSSSLNGQDMKAFIMSSVSFLGLWGMAYQYNIQTW
jgi:cytochrome d ubiquinol oxidase subunit II